MKQAPKYLICKHCGNLVEVLHDAGVPVICCGEAMEVMQAGSVDAAVEKHVPAYQVAGNKISVQVGEVIHPMLEEHYIGWIWLETKLGGQRRSLVAGDEPKAEFTLADGDEAIAIYEWCNLHGVWKVDVQ